MDNTNTADSYSPLLAELLDLEDTTNVSLSDIGRRVYGSNQEYAAKRRAVDEARQLMEDALTERKGGFRMDPKMLALAQGFLAPTKTGHFGESLGTAAGLYSQAQQQEDARLRELARMRYELAQSGLAEEKELARLGIQVASKLTPQMTAIQKQILSEGLNPRSPEGQARAKELYAVTQATPDMKEFAARAGISLTSPEFSTRFQQSRSLESLRPIATRMGLDLNDPAQLAQARMELQRETLRTQQPDVAKMLDKFGGDIMSDADRKRAQTMLTQERELEMGAKQLSMEASRNQIERTQQEIAENTRLGRPGVAVEKAAELGVPADPLKKYEGLSVKEAAAQRSKDIDEAEKFINDKIIPGLQNADVDINNLTRALGLNKQIRTGMTMGLPFGVGTAVKTLSGDKKLIDEFESLAALAAKANRMPGDSNVSNADLKFMQLGTFSVDKQPETNETIISFMLEQRKRDKDYAQFMTDYAAANGILGPNAQSAWRSYLDANPIMSTDPKTGVVSLNPNRMSYREFFAAPRVRVNKQGREGGF